MGEQRHPVVNVVLLCPGQGAQRVGMGKDLAEQFAAARLVFEQVDDALGFGLSTLMWEGPESELTLTHNAQPAILTHSLAAFAVVRDAFAPILGAGHSLGEYSAYVAAGALEASDAARLVRRRGELMLEAGERRPGAMAAVIGMAGEEVARICAGDSGDGRVAVAANLNAPDQTVISGDPETVARASEHLKAKGAKRVLPLKVSGAFHSALMEPARVGLEQALAAVDIADPTFPIVANATAEPVRDAGSARRLLADQLTAPVRWVESMRRAHADAGSDTMFVEVGPGTVLAGLLKRIVPEARCVSIGTAEQANQFMEQHA